MQTKMLKTTGKLKIDVKEDAQFVLDVSFSDRVLVELNFETPGIVAELICLYSLKNKENFELETITTHVAPNTSCNTYVKGVLGDSSKSDYVGKIIIERDAHGTNSFLEDNVLVIGKETHNATAPILEIRANDVKASHGATTGRINEEQVYYLMARGLNRVEAENVIVEGFFEELLGKIKDEKIREEVRSSLELKQ